MGWGVVTRQARTAGGPAGGQLRERKEAEGLLQELPSAVACDIQGGRPCGLFCSCRRKVLMQAHLDHLHRHAHVAQDLHILPDALCCVPVLLHGDVHGGRVLAACMAQGWGHEPRLAGSAPGWTGA